jgi:hypothetical protein
LNGSHAPPQFSEFQDQALDAPAALNRFSRNALVKTDTDERLMAAAANMGLSSGPPKR